MNRAEIRRFLQAVRPPGRGYLFTLKKKRPKQTAFASNHAAEESIFKAISQREDVFVSLAQFREDSPKREGAFAEHFASVWVDIDVECGDGKAKPYASRAAGMEALEAFLSQTALPRPSLLVNSGGGIHAYWCFSEIIDKTAWQSCAKALKAVCMGMGLKIDATVTADAARIMRVPESLNLKLPESPRPVLIMEPGPEEDFVPIEFNAFHQRLTVLQAALPVTQLSQANNFADSGLFNHFPQQVDAATKAPAVEPETPEKVQAAMAALSAIDADITYPDWFRILCAVKSTGWKCAQTIAQEWSANGSKYEQATFEKQWAEIKTYGGVTLGTLFYEAKEAGWQPKPPQSAAIRAMGGIDQPGDIRNGKAYAAMHRGKLLFVKPMARWFRWDETRWAICLCGDEMEAAKETANLLLHEAPKVAAADPDKGKRLFTYALQTQNLPRLEAMIRLASSEPGMVIGEAGRLDADPWLLGVKNGVVSLKTGALLAPDPKMLITKQANAKFLPEEDCPKWLEFLEEIFNDDVETIESVQRLLGYTLTGSTTEEKMVICYGHGANGKSVFSNVVSNIIGEYYTVGPNCLLVARDKSDNSVRNDLAKLFGTRLISVNELAAGARLDEQVIKQLAGREPISARFLHKEFFDFMPTGKVWLRTNHRPIIIGEDDGIWRRLVLLHFKRKFFEEEQDIHLEEKLLQEREGILAWMVRGAVKWQQYGLVLSPTILSELRAYRTESDLLGEFLADKTTVSASGRFDQSDLFSKWKDWCEECGLRSGSKAGFTRKLSERGYGEAKSNGRRFYQGLEVAKQGR
jgi:putative DNA primase/helicase